MHSANRTKSAGPIRPKPVRSGPIADVGELLALRLDPAGELPLQQQLVRELREAVLSGRLAPRFRLPPTRLLARDLGVSRNTVLAAFEQLAAEGYLEGKVGAGTYVAALTPEAHLAAPKPKLGPKPGRRADTALRRISTRAAAVTEIQRPRSRPARAFGVGIPDLDGFPFDIWGRLIAKHWRRPPRELLTARDAAGHLPLREAIAAYLNAFRATQATPGQVIVTAGAQAGLDLAVRVMLEPREQVWIEDPGYAGFRAVLAAADVAPVPLPVDAEGLSVAEGRKRAPQARLAFVSPSHQFPLGTTMTLARRLELIDWAAEADAFILEDDYDSEYRYDGRPIPSLQGLDSAGRVIYVGSFSKVMFPALRLGYLVLPEALVEPFLRVRSAIDDHPSIVAQPALAEFIASGAFATHIRKSRKRYAERKEALERAFAKHLSGVLSLRPIDAGLHAVAEILRPGLRDTAIADAAASAGVVIAPLSAFDSGKPLGRRPGLNGILLGFAGVGEREIDRATAKLASAIHGLH